MVVVALDGASAFSAAGSSVLVEAAAVEVVLEEAEEARVNGFVTVVVGADVAGATGRL